jgi:polar amino acid transport system substrate-binding protein
LSWAGLIPRYRRRCKALGLRGGDENPDDWELVGEPLSAAPYAIGLPENDSKFRDLFNVALMELWESGEHEMIYDRWFGKSTGFPLPLEGWLEV